MCASPPLAQPRRKGTQQKLPLSSSFGGTDVKFQSWLRLESSIARWSGLPTEGHTQL